MRVRVKLITRRIIFQTMDQAHLLADEILDDILDETVFELQR